jgi:hypothetical protein
VPELSTHFLVASSHTILFSIDIQAKKNEFAWGTSPSGPSGQFFRSEKLIKNFLHFSQGQAHTMAQGGSRNGLCHGCDQSAHGSRQGVEGFAENNSSRSPTAFSDTNHLTRNSAETMMGLQIELEAATRVLETVHTSLSLKSGAELFLRYVTRAYLDIPDFTQCKSKLIERGEQLRTKTTSSRKQIAFLAEPFIRDGMVLLVHGFSRVVCSVLIAAAAKEKRFTVFVTESRPEPNGQRTVETLLKHNLPVTLISDSTVGAIMDKVDMVLVGAEAVVENGGIINKVRTMHTYLKLTFIVYLCSEHLFSKVSRPTRSSGCSSTGRRDSFFKPIYFSFSRSLFLCRPV